MERQTITFVAVNNQPKMNWADYNDEKDYDDNKNPWITVPKGGGTKRIQRKNNIERKRALQKFKNN